MVPGFLGLHTEPRSSFRAYGFGLDRSMQRPCPVKDSRCQVRHDLPKSRYDPQCVDGGLALSVCPQDFLHDILLSTCSDSEVLHNENSKP